VCGVLTERTQVHKREKLCSESILNVYIMVTNNVIVAPVILLSESTGKLDKFQMSTKRPPSG